MTEQIILFFSETLHLPPTLLLAIISACPVIEVRGAVPFTLSSQNITNSLDTFSCLSIVFFSSTLTLLIILFSFSFIVNALKKTKFGINLTNKLDKKVNKHLTKLNNKSNELKKLLFLMLFCALPLPLTGYYTSALIASFTTLNKFKCFLFISLGNLICIVLMYLICLCLSPYLDIIFLIFLFFFLLTLLVFFILPLFKKW